MKTITLPCFGIEIELGNPDPERPGAFLGGTITSELKYEDPLLMGNLDIDAVRFESAMDGIESMILNHAIAGIDVESPAYVEGIEEAVLACENNLL